MLSALLLTVKGGDNSKSSPVLSVMVVTRDFGCAPHSHSLFLWQEGCGLLGWEFGGFLVCEPSFLFTFPNGSSGLQAWLWWEQSAR